MPVTGSPAPEVHKAHVCLPEAILGNLVPTAKPSLREELSHQQFSYFAWQETCH